VVILWARRKLCPVGKIKIYYQEIISVYLIIAEGVDSAQTECRAELNPPMPKASRVF
jgi:hypothetical protein